MSRSGYSDDRDNVWLYRGAVVSAAKGKRGRAFLQELLDALDAMPVKRLIANEFTEVGEVCALGAVGRARGMDLTMLPHPEDEWPSEIARQFGVATALAAEVMYENDEGGWNETPEQRFARVRAWVAAAIENPKVLL